MWFSFYLNSLNSILLQVDPKYLQTDVLANIQQAFNNFLQSGQAGAAVIGLISGYVIRGITK
jgi:hypothetical protein